MDNNVPYHMKIGTKGSFLTLIDTTSYFPFFCHMNFVYWLQHKSLISLVSSTSYRYIDYVAVVIWTWYQL